MVLLLSCALAVSCGDSSDPDDSHTVTIAFRISVATASDSLSTRAMNEGWDDYSPTDPGTAYENSLNPDGIHIYMCDAAGEKLDEVDDVKLSRLSPTDYAVVGTWHDSLSRLYMARRIMVLANCDALTFRLADCRRYIPMWGVATLPQLEVGKRNDIGEVELLRAVAKVAVGLRSDMVRGGYSIASVAINRFNTEGYSVPRGYKAVANTSALRFAATLNPLASLSATPYQTTDSVAYVPEYDNTSSSAMPSTVTIVLNRNNAYEGTYTLQFRGYGTDGAPTGSAYDIMRNHLYTYTLYRSDGRIQVTLHVRDWNVRRHDAIIM